MRNDDAKVQLIQTIRNIVVKIGMEKAEAAADIHMYVCTAQATAAMGTTYFN